MDPKATRDPSKKKILVIEDEEAIIELLEYTLQREGFQVASVTNGEEGLRRIRQQPPDLLILDLMLPGIQGLELCRILRGEAATRDLPIVMVTARVEESDKVVGLELGADDYVIKPFSPRELVARVRAVLRRSRREAAPTEGLRSGRGLSVDAGSRRLFLGDRPIQLSPTEFRLFSYLFAHKDQPCSRQELLEAIWGEEASLLQPRAVDVVITRLRKQVEEDPDHPRYIQTVRGLGYLFEEGEGR